MAETEGTDPATEEGVVEPKPKRQPNETPEAEDARPEEEPVFASEREEGIPRANTQESICTETSETSDVGNADQRRQKAKTVRFLEPPPRTKVAMRDRLLLLDHVMAPSAVDLQANAEEQAREKIRAARKRAHLRAQKSAPLSSRLHALTATTAIPEPHGRGKREQRVEMDAATAAVSAVQTTEVADGTSQQAPTEPAASLAENCLSVSTSVSSTSSITRAGGGQPRVVLPQQASTLRIPLRSVSLRYGSSLGRDGGLAALSRPRSRSGSSTSENCGVTTTSITSAIGAAADADTGAQQLQPPAHRLSTPPPLVSTGHIAFSAEQRSLNAKLRTKTAANLPRDDDSTAGLDMQLLDASQFRGVFRAPEPTPVKAVDTPIQVAQLTAMQYILLREQYMSSLSHLAQAAGEAHEKYRRLKLMSPVQDVSGTSSSSSSTAIGAKQASSRDLAQCRAQVARIQEELGVLAALYRSASLDVVRAIRKWTRLVLPRSDSVTAAQKDGVAFLWRDRNYLSKMYDDLSFLDMEPCVRLWVGFSASKNPFLLPPTHNFSAWDRFVRQYEAFRQWSRLRKQKENVERLMRIQKRFAGGVEHRSNSPSASTLQSPSMRSTGDPNDQSGGNARVPTDGSGANSEDAVSDAAAAAATAAQADAAPGPQDCEKTTTGQSTSIGTEGEVEAQSAKDFPASCSSQSCGSGGGDGSGDGAIDSIGDGSKEAESKEGAPRRSLQLVRSSVAVIQRALSSSKLEASASLGDDIEDEAISQVVEEQQDMREHMIAGEMDDEVRAVIGRVLSEPLNKHPAELEAMVGFYDLFPSKPVVAGVSSALGDLCRRLHDCIVGEVEEEARVARKFEEQRSARNEFTERTAFLRKEESRAAFLDNKCRVAAASGMSGTLRLRQTEGLPAPQEELLFAERNEAAAAMAAEADEAAIRLRRNQSDFVRPSGAMKGGLMTDADGDTGQTTFLTAIDQNAGAQAADVHVTSNRGLGYPLLRQSQSAPQIGGSFATGGGGGGGLGPLRDRASAISSGRAAQHGSALSTSMERLQAMADRVEHEREIAAEAQAILQERERRHHELMQRRTDLQAYVERQVTCNESSVADDSLSVEEVVALTPEQAQWLYCSVTRVQTHVRGTLARRRVANIRYEREMAEHYEQSALVIQRCGRGMCGRRRAWARRQEIHAEAQEARRRMRAIPAAARVLHRFFRAVAYAQREARKLRDGELSGAGEGIHPEEHAVKSEAAMNIQRVFRGRVHRGKADLAQQARYARAAKVLQGWVRRSRTRVRTRLHIEAMAHGTEAETAAYCAAAVRIQCMYRRFVARRRVAAKRRAVLADRRLRSKDAAHRAARRAAAHALRAMDDANKGSEDLPPQDNPRVLHVGLSTEEEFVTANTVVDIPALLPPSPPDVDGRSILASIGLFNTRSDLADAWKPTHQRLFGTPQLASAGSAQWAHEKRREQESAQLRQRQAQAQVQAQPRRRDGQV